MCVNFVRPSVRGPCEQDRDYTVVCFFVKFGRHVHYDNRINPIDLLGQRSKVKITIDIYENTLVNTIETKPLCVSSLNLADMFSYSERMDPIDFGGQRSSSQFRHIWQ